MSFSGIGKYVESFIFYWYRFLNNRNLSFLSMANNERVQNTLGSEGITDIKNISDNCMVIYNKKSSRSISFILLLNHQSLYLTTNNPYLFQTNNNANKMENIREAQRRLLTLSLTVKSDVHDNKSMTALKVLLMQLALEGSLDERKFREAFNMTLAASVGFSTDDDVFFMDFINQMYNIKDELLQPNADMDLEGALKEIVLLHDTVKDMNVLQQGSNPECVLLEARINTFLHDCPCSRTEKTILVDVLIMCAGEASNRDKSGTLGFVCDELKRIKTSYNIC